ncbi:unnamed protein product [Phytophthora fragariaefolia]|uniref:Unnamed protein product n=1 Tax=Phytophthora fragariaefolia TaxID=1490495 RepID=A0A9W6YHK0_9STRA|nr:unnamed protein product [Phytophthora fragariaefolia]
MEYERGAENLSVDMNMSTGSLNTPATHVAHEDCPHLADLEWEALQRLSTVIGEAAVATMLRALSPTEQHGVALGFIMKEQREVAARATVSTPSTPRVESLKLHVNSYVGREGEPLLRWLVKVDRLDVSSTRCQRLRSPCHVLADEQGVGRMDAESLILRALARTKYSIRSSDKHLSPRKMNLDRGLSSSICNKVSMTCMLTPKERGTWSRTS